MVANLFLLRNLNNYDGRRDGETTSRLTGKRRLAFWGCPMLWFKQVFLQHAGVTLVLRPTPVSTFRVRGPIIDYDLNMGTTRMSTRGLTQNAAAYHNIRMPRGEGNQSVGLPL